MASALDGKNVKIISLEKDPANAKVALVNIKKAGFDDIIEIKIGDAKELIPTLSGTYDLLFIDAMKDEYLTYLLAAEKKLEKKAVVVADNVKIFEEDMSDYLEYVRKSGKYESRTFDVGYDAFEVSIKR